MSNLVENPYPIFTDTNGEPLEDGYIYIGEPGLSPISNPVQAYWDTNFTVPANEVRTKGGYPHNSGSPGRLYVDGNYSITVHDRLGSIMYTKLNTLDYSNELTAGIVSSVDTLEDLRDLVPGEAYVQMSVAGATIPGDGAMGPLYYWEPTSVETDNGSSIIKPFTVTGAGRWLWIGTTDTIATITVTATGTVTLGETSLIVLVDSASNTIQTLTDGTFQGQELTVYKKGAGSIQLAGTGITSGVYIYDSRKIVWLDAGWEDIPAVAYGATYDVLASTSQATVYTDFSAYLADGERCQVSGGVSSTSDGAIRTFAYAYRTGTTVYIRYAESILDTNGLANSTTGTMTCASGVATNVPGIGMYCMGIKF